MNWRNEATVRETNPDGISVLSAVGDTTEVESHDVDGAAMYDSSVT